MFLSKILEGVPDTTVTKCLGLPGTGGLSMNARLFNTQTRKVSDKLR